MEKKNSNNKQKGIFVDQMGRVPEHESLIYIAEFPTVNLIKAFEKAGKNISEEEAEVVKEFLYLIVRHAIKEYLYTE